MDLIAWLPVLGGNITVVVGVVHVFRGWLRQDYRQVAGGVTLGAIGTAVLWARPTPGKLMDWLDRELGGEAPAPTAPPSPGSDPDLFPGWGLWALVASLGVAAVTAAVVPAVRRLRRRRNRAAADLARRAALEAEHEAVLNEYAAYVTDVLAFLDRPALDDVTAPQTAEFLHAMDAADDARRGDDLGAYRKALSILKTAWRAADEHARRVGLGALPATERAAVGKARNLLELALDGSGGDHERHAAYAKARALLDGVLTIPRQAVAELETRNRLTLTVAKVEGA
ncbi:hypothetical protein [Streptomyces sp. NPDC007369]|uniref:hypothetical protein n=1 Tax=Streptomyces sp. NPDC007369 TaxID=3154589 RepID=UPI003409A654